jgi:diguanylate cyclase (GGDEF)-like protein/PAS domain S-box-containing protein
MDMPKQQVNGMKKRVLPVHLLEILVWLAHLACLALLWSIQPRFDQVLMWVFVSLVIATAIPFGPVAGLASGFGLALAERLATVFRSGVTISQIGPQLLDHLSANWTYLVIWPLAGLLAGLYATQFSRSSRHQARKAWELARTNEQLKTKVSHYENRFNQGRPSSDWPDGRPATGYSSAQMGYLSYFLHEALALRTHSLTSQATRQTPDTLPETIFEVITESCPATIAIIDTQGIILHSHHRVLAMFGFAADLTRPGCRFERLLTPESAALMQTLVSGQGSSLSDAEPNVLTLALSGKRFGKSLLVPEVIVSSDNSQNCFLVRLSRSDLHANLQLGWPAGEIPASLAELLGPEGCCLAPDGTITYIHADTASKLGETVTAIQGHKLGRFISNDSLDVYNQAVHDCRNGLATRAELVLYPYGRKGSLHYQIQVYPSLDLAGNLVAMTVRLFDLTAKKQTESMLSRRLDIEQMIALISSRFIAVKADGLEREIISVLRLVCEFENALECSIEMVPSSYFRRRSSMSYQNENRLLELQTASSSQISDRYETIGVPIEIDSEMVAYVRIKQDKYRDLWFDSDLKLIRLIGEIIVNAQIRSDNIQAIKLNERRLATTLHSIGEGVIATDPDGHIILMNRRAEQMTGWTWNSARSMALGQVFSPAKAQVSDEENNRWTIRHLRPLSETDNSLLLISRSGERFFISMTTSRIEDERGQFYGEVTVFRDVTQSKKENDAIRYISYHDRLTGLYNRAFFEEEMLRLNTMRQYPITIILGDCNGLKISNDIFGHLEGDRLLKAIASIIRQSIRHEDIASRWGGDEFAIILPQTDEPGAKVICDRILNLCVQSEHRPIPPSLSLGCATASSPDTDLTDLLKLAEDRMYRHKLMESKSYRNNLIYSIEKMVFEKSYETEEHASRLSDLSQRIGQAIGLNDYEMEELRLLSVLHDVGKIGIPDKILAKDGPLNREEWDVMRKHPEKGYNLAKATPELKNIAEAILHHHERWDGTGYPSGLKGEEIPKLSRILSIIDTFDVITHSRSYKKAQSVQAALHEIELCAGSQFDPELSRIFIGIMQDVLRETPELFADLKES